MTDAQLFNEIALAIGKVGSVLDVGCGNCALVRFLAQNVADEAIGIDLSWDTSLEPARLDFAKGYGTATCMKGDVHSIGFPDGRFDSVVALRSLHEFRKPEISLSEMERVLKSGGTLVIVDFSEREPSEDETYYSEEGLRKFLGSKFSDVKVQRYDRDNLLLAVCK
jgi:ubiquinone/menaquinone biosynthesis C-methylase UbiE